MPRIRDLGINAIPGASRADGDPITPVLGDPELFAGGDESNEERRGGGCGTTRPQCTESCSHTEDDDEDCDKQCTNTKDDDDCGSNTRGQCTESCSHTEYDDACDQTCSHTQQDEECDAENNCSHTEYVDDCNVPCSHTEDDPPPKKKQYALGADAIGQLTRQLESHLARELEN